MYADVLLAAGRQADVLTIPINALQRGQNSSSVLVVNANDRVQKREVQTGMQDSNKVEVISGVSEGDRAIVGNLASYREDELVRPKKSTPMPANTETE
jgi:macrolide-specific efflux system membrane fusion protein